MARKQASNMPVTGGVRRRRLKTPRMNPNGSVIEYSALGGGVSTDPAGLWNGGRPYVPGTGNSLVNTVGPNIVSFYSTAKFLPGTKLRWEPSVSFNTTGRVYVGFTDNPEVMASIVGLTGGAYVNAVKGLGDVISFPIWQETDIPFPTKLRRKMFDVNSTITVTDVNAMDRSAQTFFFAAIDGAPASSSMGSFWFHDRLAVEGITPVVT